MIEQIKELFPKARYLEEVDELALQSFLFYKSKEGKYIALPKEGVTERENNSYLCFSQR